MKKSTGGFAAPGAREAARAARLVAEAAGMLPGGAPSSPLLEFSLSLSAEDARKLSTAVKAEQRRRKKP